MLLLTPYSDFLPIFGNCKISKMEYKKFPDSRLEGPNCGLTLSRVDRRNIAEKLRVNKLAVHQAVVQRIRNLQGQKRTGRPRTQQV